MSAISFRQKGNLAHYAPSKVVSGVGKCVYVWIKVHSFVYQ